MLHTRKRRHVSSSDESVAPIHPSLRPMRRLPIRRKLQREPSNPRPALRPALLLHRGTEHGYGFSDTESSSSESDETETELSAALSDVEMMVQPTSPSPSPHQAASPSAKGKWSQGWKSDIEMRSTASPPSPSPERERDEVDASLYDLGPEAEVEPIKAGLASASARAQAPWRINLAEREWRDEKEGRGSGGVEGRGRKRARVDESPGPSSSQSQRQDQDADDELETEEILLVKPKRASSSLNALDKSKKESKREIRKRVGRAGSLAPTQSIMDITEQMDGWKLHLPKSLPGAGAGAARDQADQSVSVSTQHARIAPRRAGRTVMADDLRSHRVQPYVKPEKVCPGPSHAHLAAMAADSRARVARHGSTRTARAHPAVIASRIKPSDLHPYAHDPFCALPAIAEFRETDFRAARTSRAPFFDPLPRLFPGQGRLLLPPFQPAESWEFPFEFPHDLARVDTSTEVLPGQRTKATRNLRRRSPTSLLPIRHRPGHARRSHPASTTTRRGGCGLTANHAIAGQLVLECYFAQRLARANRLAALQEARDRLADSAHEQRLMRALRLACAAQIQPGGQWEVYGQQRWADWWWIPGPRSALGLYVPDENDVEEVGEDEVAVSAVLGVSANEAGGWCDGGGHVSSDASTSMGRAGATYDTAISVSSDSDAGLEVEFEVDTEQQVDAEIEFDMDTDTDTNSDADADDDDDASSTISDPPPYDSNTYPRHIPYRPPPVSSRNIAAPIPRLPSYIPNRYTRSSPSPPPPFNAETDRQTLVAPFFIDDASTDDGEGDDVVAVQTRSMLSQRSQRRRTQRERVTPPAAAPTRALTGRTSSGPNMIGAFPGARTSTAAGPGSGTGPGPGTARVRPAQYGFANYNRHEDDARDAQMAFDLALEMEEGADEEMVDDLFATAGAARGGGLQVGGQDGGEGEGATGALAAVSNFIARLWGW